MIGKGFELAMGGSLDDWDDSVRVSLNCLRCKKWSKALADGSQVRLSLEEINKAADVHEHKCPEVR